MKLSAQEAVCLCTRLVCVSHALACIELLMRDRVLRDDGMMSWPVMRLRSALYVHPRWETALNWLFGYPHVRRVLVARLTVAVVLLLGPNHWILGPVLLPMLAAIDLVYAMRSNFGNDGADQMTTLVTVSFAVAAVAPGARTVALGFLAIQLCMAYGVAGWTKALPFRKEWWNGQFVVGVSKTHTFGTPAFGEFLGRHAALAAGLSTSMLLWEIGFPLVLVLPLRMALVFCLVGLSFHLVTAFHMGLNTFLWAFGATYPALFFILTLRGY